MIPAANLRYMWDTVINPRIGSAYSWGGSFDPNDTSVGTDCSGAVSAVIEALVNGPSMDWNRQFWTGTFADLKPGDVGPFGLVCIPNPGAAPPDAAAIVAINQGPSADTSHMIVRVMDRSIDPEGVDIEDDGQGLQKYEQAANITDSQFNQWLYLPGPIETPLSRQDRYALLIIQAGRQRNVTPRGIKIALATALVESNLTNYANTNDPASLQLPHDAVGSDGMSVGVFQQQNFAEWGSLQCRMDVACSATTFYNHLLAGPDYNDESHTPGWYAQQVQRSAFPDRYDERYGEAETLYNRLVTAPIPAPAPSQEGELTPDESRMLREIHAALFTPSASTSPFRHLVDTPWQLVQLLHNADQFAHPEYVAWAARMGDPTSLALLTEVANADPGRYPDRQADAKLARSVLNSLRTPAPQPATPAPATPPQSAPAPPIPGPAGPVASIADAVVAAANSIEAALQAAAKQTHQALIGGQGN